MKRLPSSMRPAQAPLKRSRLRYVLLSMLATPVALSALAEDDPRPKKIPANVEAGKIENAKTGPLEGAKGNSKKKAVMVVEREFPGPSPHAHPNHWMPLPHYPGNLHGAPPVPNPGMPSWVGANGFTPPAGNPPPSPAPHYQVPSTGGMPKNHPSGSPDLLAPGGPIWKQWLELEREKLKAQAQAELTEMKFNLFAEQAEQNMLRLKEMLHEKEKHSAELHEKLANQRPVHEKLEHVVAQSEAEKRELRAIIEKLEHQLRETREHTEHLEREIEELRHRPHRPHPELHQGPHHQAPHDRDGSPHDERASHVHHAEIAPQVHQLLEQAQRWEHEIRELREMFNRAMQQWRERAVPHRNREHEEGPPFPTNDHHPRGEQPHREQPHREQPHREQPHREQPRGERFEAERPAGERRPEPERRRGDQPRPERERGEI